MTRYRKKPVVVDAIRVSEALLIIYGDGPDKLPEWFRNAYSRDGAISTAGAGGMLVKTLEGVMQANKEDWIICGVSGECYPCKPDIFAKTYDAVEE